MTNDLNINPPAEQTKITYFIRNILKRERFKNVVIGVSGGVDSAASFSLLEKSISPQNIYVAYLHYFKSQIDLITPMLEKANIPHKNIYNLSIKDSVDLLEKAIFPIRYSGKRQHIQNLQMIRDSGQARVTDLQQVRLGNIMARVRMIILYDLAKKHNALVCGTENKSEFYLGYFTRFGDEASDFEPIQHLYKTQVYQLAKYLNIPQQIINQAPTAGLWAGQTDEGDFGFSYKEADAVLHLYFEEKNSISEIASKGFKNAEEIIDWANKNSFKHHLPYVIK